MRLIYTKRFRVVTWPKIIAGGKWRTLTLIPRFELHTSHIWNVLTITIFYRYIHISYKRRSK